MTKLNQLSIFKQNINSNNSEQIHILICQIYDW